MSRIIKAGLIQAHNQEVVDAPIEKIKKANIDHQMKFVEDAAKQGVQMLCFQEIFTTPYFCAEQQTRWYEAVEKIPDGPTVKLMQDVAKQHGMVLVVPVYEEEQTGVYYNSAAVIDADGKYLGKYRKTHILTSHPASGKSFTSGRAISATRVLTLHSAGSVFTYAMTGTSRKVPDASV
jgi:beta-ureidopropionase